MEKHITQKLEKFQLQFKNDIKEWLTSHNATVVDKTTAATNFESEFLKYVYDYNSMTMNETDFKKRKRIKNVVPEFELCIAKRDGGEQCTRRKKKYKDETKVTHFCGTHIKGTPHGIVTNDASAPNPNNKIEVWVKDIKGINYYIDSQNNVYNPEDILANKVNPKIIAKWSKTEDDVYSIPKFGI
jgi:hypothetical protein